MATNKLQSIRSLRTDMTSVARGARKPPRGAAQASFDSIDPILRLLTRDNRDLLAKIRAQKPSSIADLGRITGRSPASLARTLNQLEAAGLIEFITTADGQKAPRSHARKLTIEIDLRTNRDRLKVT